MSHPRYVEFTSHHHAGHQRVLRVRHGLDVGMRDGIEHVVLQLVVWADVDVRTLVARGVDVVGRREDYSHLY